MSILSRTMPCPPRRDLSPRLSRITALLLGAALLHGCGRLEIEDVITPTLLEASMNVRPEMPFEPADVRIVLGLEAGMNAGGQTASFQYARLFERSTWRTNEPTVHLDLRQPEGLELPFEAGEARQLHLEGYVPNDHLAPYCDHDLRLLVTIRTSGVHSLLGVSENVRVECE